ncbi:MAG: hypothetical protein EHM33_07525 [Chloroflexi bacterium]|nr:MAG: hypothetical protein EHM33_07525 [Chloroflexota bacterium]
MVGKNILLISTVALFTLAFATPASDIIKPGSSGNPAPQKDNFSQWPDFGEGQDWRYYIVDGNSGSVSVNGILPFDNSTAEITSGNELRFLQDYDADFDEEYPAQYNNVAMIGFQGYIPNTQRDIVWKFDMKIEPGTYGTTGFVIERKDTFAPDGTVALPFDFFGVTYAGEENYNVGLRCSDVVDFLPVSQDLIAGVDPFVWNDYEIRFHLVDSETVLASISVNNTEVCQTTRANVGETEVQIWLDNYKVTFDPLNPLGYSLGYNNQETPQAVLFDNIQAKAKPSN